MIVNTTSNGFMLQQGTVYETTLPLGVVTAEDSGLYSCTVSLDNGRQQLTTERNLNVTSEYLKRIIILNKIYYY